MPAPTPSHRRACDPTALRRYLAGACAVAEERSIEQHLTDCPSCRQAMERQAAEPEFWQAAARQLDTRRDLTNDTQHPPLVPPQALLAARPEWEDYLRTWLASGEASGSLGEIETYQVQEVVGIGGMGLVLRARDPALQRDVAIKTLRPELAANQQARQRFTREAQLAASLHHPNVVSIFHVGSWRGVEYIVMPLVEQGSLRDYVASGSLTLDQIILLGRQVASGLAAAHAEGMIHRDIKPSNILLRGGLAEVVVADFGLARVVGGETMTLSGEVHGTPQFMSPEQARGATLDARSDLFSLGSLLYWMATGRSPFEADNHFATLTKIQRVEYPAASKLNADLPLWFDRLVAGLLVADPDARRFDASGLVRIFSQLAEHRRQPERAPLPPELATHRSSPARSLKRWGAALGGGAVAVALMYVLIKPWLTGPTQPVVAPPSFTPANPATPLSNADDAEDAEDASSSLLRDGPLDELDRVNLVADLKADRRVSYWLQRLASLPAHDIPPKALPLLAEQSQRGTATQRKLAESILQKNPFIPID